MLIPVFGIKPQIADNCFMAANCSISGDVLIEDNSSIWFQAVIRGDVVPIKIGKRTNIQDGVMIHGSTGGQTVEIGDDVTIGHHAIVHGCTIKSDVLIGMGAIVLDGAVVNSGAVIAAGAVVTENTVVPAGALYAGVPARQVKMYDLEKQIVFHKASAAHYVEMAQEYKNSGRA